MKQLFKTLPQKLKKLLQFLLNPRFLLCFGLGWMITNGWSYALLGLGTFYDIGWMKAVAGAYLAILWFPFSPEKIITVAIAIGLLQWLFPGDTYTLGVLRDMRTKAVEAARRSREERRARREANRIRFREERQIPQQPSGEERDT